MDGPALDALSASLSRAREAIARARSLSSRLPNAAGPDIRIEHSGEISLTSESSEVTSSTANVPHVLVTTPPAQLHDSSYLPSLQPVILVAQKLSLLHRQQSNTMQQLTLLRLEQLTLRQQQLTALQALLRAEVEAVEGTPQQVSAVEAALSLLNQSLEEAEDVALAVLGSKPDMQQVALAVSRADLRAEEVSRMARSLLSVLREYPRRAATLPPLSTAVPGASEIAMGRLPTLVLPPYPSHTAAKAHSHQPSSQPQTPQEGTTDAPPAASPGAATVCDRCSLLGASCVHAKGSLCPEEQDSVTFATSSTAVHLPVHQREGSARTLCIRTSAGPQLTPGASAVANQHTGCGSPVPVTDPTVSSPVCVLHDDRISNAGAQMNSSAPARVPGAACQLLGEVCPICLDSFEPGHVLKCMACLHYCHAACLDQWLRIRGLCPLCKTAIDEEPLNPSDEQHV